MSEIRETYHNDGEIASISYHNEKGLLHREGDLPSILCFFKSGTLKSEKYCINGQKHREDNKPAYIKYNKNGDVIYIAYYKNDKLHNDTDAALLKYYDNGILQEEKHCLNGQYLILDCTKPAHSVFFRSGKIKLMEYYKNYVLHRDFDMPAFISYYENGDFCTVSYFINGNNARISPDLPSSVTYEKGVVIYQKFSNEKGEFSISDNFRRPVEYYRNESQTIYKIGNRLMKGYKYIEFLSENKLSTNPMLLTDEEVDTIKLLFY